jgi:isopenicillin N synthase-like dioxygenase
MVPALPVIDLTPLRDRDDVAAMTATAEEIDAACRTTGFFVAVGHGVPPALGERVEALARDFFSRSDEEKSRIAMEHGGRAWRGWFPLDGELTSGAPDHKEGLYLGKELGPDHPAVRAGRPLAGPNLFPAQPAGLRGAVLSYLDAVTAVGHAVLAGMALGLGLDAGWFHQNLTGDPTVLLRIFRYPPLPAGSRHRWSVGEHTDYGLITLLRQDDTGGLEVHGPHGWIDAHPVPDSFVVNLGDMLERMTAGRYRSTPHRVRNPAGADRISIPLFLDPAWDAEVRPVPGLDAAGPAGGRHRWDGRSVHEWSGTYGDYLLDKVRRVFPDLGERVLDR